jgi:putative hydrolase of the HAD superfamily
VTGPDASREATRAASSEGFDAVVAVLDGARALLLDVDDTIVDTREAMVVAGTQALRALWPAREGDHRAMAERYYADPEGWFPRYASGSIAFEAMRSGRLAEVARAFGADLATDALGDFEDAYGPAFRDAQRLFPDVPDLLAAAEEGGLPVALLTNSASAPTQVKLEVLELAARFEVVVTTDTLGFGKPDPRVYREACRLVGVDPAAVVCIGDSIAWDVVGARDAGLRALWLDRGGLGTDEDVVGVEGLDVVARALRATRFGGSEVDR